ncbi:MAG TPA: DNA mismatch repair protein MutS, partial [Terriglobales bacterium]|nr:DNA mismatch repair protein MutS [Terriglobales bacterium]
MADQPSLFPAAEPVASALKITPMLEQYLRVKQENPDAILFFRLGDFYEMFFEDAEQAAAILDIALTSRSKKDDVPIPMCGVPHHAVQGYIRKLLEAGRKVAICDQVQDAAEAKGLVDRALVRVVTPGTVTEEECLDPHAPNYLVALHRDDDGIGLSAIDLSTGEVRLSALSDAALLPDELGRLGPREILAAASDTELHDLCRAALPEVLISGVPSSQLAPGLAAEWLQRSGAATDGSLPATALAALSASLWYLERTHRAGLSHLRPPSSAGRADRLHLDQATRRNLELLATGRGERRGSLLWVIDETRSPMGGRLLRDWLLNPLADLVAIGARLDAVEYAREHLHWRTQVSQDLGAIGDLERLSGRLAAGRVTPRDITGLKGTLERVARLKQVIAPVSVTALRRCGEALDPMPEIAARIGRTLADDAPLSASHGEVIRDGCDAVVDELRQLSRSGKQWITEHETRERQRTGISSLKVRYNRVFGYYIEITKPNLHLVPDDYRRKQTTASSERFVTPQLAEYESKIVGAEEKLHALELQLFQQLVGDIAAEQGRLSRTASALAEVDVYCGLAVAAEKYRFIRPHLTRERRLAIREGRHPVVERIAGRAGFVPNDCALDPLGPQIVTITGPNMAGKSTFLRQVAQIVLLAQMGSFVPAAEAEIGLVDRLFTRVGASDNLAGGESTFMVEMRETADILNHLTERSLVILDEIGRGTSTFDGISIAWAVAEYLHASAARPLVLFATHYHELTDLA